MDSNYIIDRLKSTLYKQPTVAVLQTRLNNLDAESKDRLIASLKKQIYIERNMDIKEHLSELIYRLPIAS
ncbi:hypothetical protein [Flavobacterium wongokense]|uniref:hypothetical protein n=1 Tax=Flavobacterium wongokense TaxID=2910674 RepID=UPI001F2A2DCF|nr:hypothetical protein [Flavobacterium sp. WG47]MCF6131694.1 hypothetical protein [Flavobacterium sp. WG47]